MSPRDRVIDLSARAALRALTSVVKFLPDATLARLFRLLAGVAARLTGEPAAAAPIMDVAEIFEAGPPYSTTLRKLLAHPEPEFVSSAARCMAGRSPHGAL